MPQETPVGPFMKIVRTELPEMIRYEASDPVKVGICEQTSRRVDDIVKASRLVHAEHKRSARTIVTEAVFHFIAIAARFR